MNLNIREANQMKKIKLSGEIIISFLFILVGIAAMLTAMGYGLWSRITPFKGFMPFLGGLLMTISSLAWLISSMHYEKNNNESPPQNTFSKTEIYWMLGIPGMCFAIYFLINILGMHTTLAIFLLLWLKFISKYTWKKTIIYTIVTSAAFYLIFTVGLAVPFPQGHLL